MVSPPSPQDTNVIQGLFSKHIRTGSSIISLTSDMTVCCYVSINLRSFVGTRIVQNRICICGGKIRVTSIMQLKIVWF